MEEIDIKDTLYIHSKKHEMRIFSNIFLTAFCHWHKNFRVMLLLGCSHHSRNLNYTTILLADIGCIFPSHRLILFLNKSNVILNNNATDVFKGEITTYPSG